MLVFLTGSTRGGVDRSDYFSSANCCREFRCAVEHSKPMVFIEETDPQHGHVPLDVHKRACPEELRHAFNQALVVPWYRVKAFQNESLRLIIQRVLQRPGSANGRVDQDSIYIHDPLMPTKLVLADPSGNGFHVYTSPNNAGAAAVAELLVEEASVASAGLASSWRNSNVTLQRPKGSNDSSPQLRRYRHSDRTLLLLLYLDAHLHERERSTHLVKERDTLDDGTTTVGARLRRGRPR